MHSQRIHSGCEMVLVGGGHSHAIVLESWIQRRPAGVKLTLVTRELHAPYSGMVPGLIAGHYDFEDAHIALEPLAFRAGVRLVQDRVSGIDLKARQVLREGGPPLPFDLLSLNVGSTPPLDGVPGASKHAISIKPIDSFLQAWRVRYDKLKQSDSPRLNLAVVGGGVGGVEVILALDHCLRSDPLLASLAGFRPCLALVSGSEPLQEQPERVRRIFKGILSQRGIQVHQGSPVTEVMEDSIRLESGVRVAADMVIWVTGASAPRWIAECGLGVDERGFMQVNDHLQSVSHPFVFGGGDVVDVVGQRRPKAGVFAVRQGRPLFENLVRWAQGEPLKTVRLQKRFLTLISTGGRHAVGTRNGIAVQGDWVWKWKNRIDRAFMRRFAR